MSEQEAFKIALSTLRGNSRAPETSKLRLAVRDGFAEIAAARKRGATWQQVADTLAAAGVPAMCGAAPSAAMVAAAYHAERYARGGRRNSQRGMKPSHVQPAPPIPSPVPPLPPLGEDCAKVRLNNIQATIERRSGR